jgi:hypothetical protein
MKTLQMNKFIKYYIIFIIVNFLVYSSFASDKNDRNLIVVSGNNLSEANRNSYNIINIQGLKLKKKQNIQRTNGTWVIFLETCK